MLSRGRHLCSAGRPSGWALAHILVSYLLPLLVYLLLLRLLRLLLRLLLVIVAVVVVVVVVVIPRVSGDCNMEQSELGNYLHLP